MTAGLTPRRIKARPAKVTRTQVRRLELEGNLEDSGRLPGLPNIVARGLPKLYGLKALFAVESATLGAARTLTDCHQSARVVLRLRALRESMGPWIRSLALGFWRLRWSCFSKG